MSLPSYLKMIKKGLSMTEREISKKKKKSASFSQKGHAQLMKTERQNLLKRVKKMLLLFFFFLIQMG